MCSITGHTCYLRIPTFLRGMLYICPYLYNAFDLRKLEETSHHVMLFRRIGNSTSKIDDATSRMQRYIVPCRELDTPNM